MDLLELNEQYYCESGWESWIGPRWVASSDEDARIVNSLREEVERIFQEANKIRECVDRHRRVLTAKPAAWQLHSDGKPYEDEAAKEALSRLLGWMIPKSSRSRYSPKTQTPLHFPNAIAEAVHVRLLGGTGYLRLWKPQRFRSAPLHRQVALHSPDPSAIEFVEDADGFPYQVKYRYEENNTTFTEVQELRADGKTHFWTEDEAGKKTDEYTLDLGGRFTVVRIQGTPIVSEAVRRLQDGINYVLTLKIRNLQYGGFLRDVIMNALPPGDFDDAGRFIPDSAGWAEGPGQKLELRGMPLFDEEGNIKSYTQPSVDTRNPVDVESFLKSFRSSVALMYEAFGQGHILANDAVLSGVSRQQLRMDFALSASEDEAALRVALSDLYAAAYLLTAPTAPPELDVIVEPRLAIAELMPEEQQAVINLYNADLRSQQSAMSLVGVENPEAEIKQIDDRKKQRMRSREATLEDLLGGKSYEDKTRDRALA